MRSTAALGVLLSIGSVAHAEERATTFTLAGMAGAFERQEQDHDYVSSYAEPIAGPRLTLAWEHAPLELPAARGYRFAGALVPELVGGAFVEDDRAQLFVGAGLRAELKMSQREMGLLRISARAAAYIAGRGMVVGDEQKPYGELAIGEYLYVGRTTRIGFEAGVLFGRPEQMTEYGSQPSVGGIVQAYIGWTP